LQRAAHFLVLVLISKQSANLKTQNGVAILCL
jgi:hypothetical protein